MVNFNPSPRSSELSVTKEFVLTGSVFYVAVRPTTIFQNLLELQCSSIIIIRSISFLLFTHKGHGMGQKPV